MERKQITVKSMVEPRTFEGKNGKVTSYAIMGEDGLKYETMSSSIAGYFVVGKALDIEVEDKAWSKGDVSGVNHSIKQVYIDGQPVSGQKKTEGSGWSGGKSDPVKNASIEMQHYSSEVRELWIAGKLKDDAPLVKCYLEILSEKLNSKVLTDNPQKPQAAPVVQKETSKPANTNPKAESAIPTTIQGLMQWAAKHGKNCTPSWVEKMLDVKDTSEIKDIALSYHTLKELNGWID
jgi:hypothetical protein